MKNSIKLTAVLLLASASVFAVTPSKIKAGTTPAKSEISFSSLPSLQGVQVKVDGNAAAKAAVIIYDADRNVVYKDVMPAYKSMEKGYILTKLEVGSYSMEITSNHQTLKKDIVVYDEDGSREFIVKQ